MEQDWLAFHIFYASDSNPIIAECVKPFVDERRRDGTLAGWFFIKYWQEGPHLRVRLKPAPGVDPSVVRADFLDAAHTFLKRRPALYETDADELGELYHDMFLAEYSQEEWDRLYGREGKMPFRENNSVHEFPYEPEYGRYGGPVGMEIAEWHFERSSDVVANLLDQTNTHVRPLLLGLSMQLTLMMAYAFLETDEAVGRFFGNYRSFWETSYAQPSDDYHENFDKSFALSSEALLARIDRIKHDLQLPDEELGTLERQWLCHSRDLKAKVIEAAPRLDFGGRALPFATQEDYESLAAVLLSSYIHMTNNRLGAAILDEIYLSYLIEQATIGQPVAVAP